MDWTLLNISNGLKNYEKDVTCVHNGHELFSLPSLLSTGWFQGGIRA